MAIHFNHLILEVQKSKFVTGIGLVCTNPPSTQHIIPKCCQYCSHQFWVLLLGWKQVYGSQELHPNTWEGPTWTSALGTCTP